MCKTKAKIYTVKICDKYSLLMFELEEDVPTPSGDGLDQSTIWSNKDVSGFPAL